MAVSPDDPLIHPSADPPVRFSLLLSLRGSLRGRATIITAFSRAHVEYKASSNLRVPGAAARLRPASGIRPGRVLLPTGIGSYREMEGSNGPIAFPVRVLLFGYF